MDLTDRREAYVAAGLDIDDLAPDPLTQFERWYAEAVESGIWEPNSMVVATVDDEGFPEARFVLLKSFDADGFVFYTNYDSAKGEALDRLGRAGLNFGWLELRRQVRLVGDVERTSDAEAEAYFATRERGSQLGAWASPQSHRVADRAELEGRYTEAAARFSDSEVPRPPNWGGYRVRPQRIEFWQGRPNRFHDRLRYVRSGDDWTIERLAP
jgi:pyridoxamine 5'-phosphate oxidase